MKINKIVAGISAGVLGLASIPVANLGVENVFESLTASAEDGASVNFNLVPENAYIKESDIENGDVAIKVKMYIEPTDSSEKFDIAQFEFAVSSEDNMYTKNISNPTKANDNSTTYTYSGGTFTSEYTPFCFGCLVDDENGTTVYSVNGTSFRNNSYGVAYGDNNSFDTYIYSDGQGGVYFTANLAETAGGEKVTKTYASNPSALGLSEDECEDIEVYFPESGGVRLRYDYIDQSTFNEKTKTLEYPYFDDSLAKGEQIYGYGNKAVWWSSNDVEILGEKDEFAFCEFDVVLKQGTEKGTYTVSLADDEDFSCFVKGDSKYSVLDGTATVSEATIMVVDDDFVASTEESTEEITTQATQSTTESTTAETDNLKTLTTVYGLQIALLASDVNGDETIDSRDAVAVLIDYANSLAGKSTTLKDGYGDANVDGEVDAKDAILILKYYANSLSLHPKNSLYSSSNVSSSTSDTSSNATITIGTVEVDTNSTTASVPVTISDNSGFAGTGFVYTYDSELTFTEIDSDDLNIGLKVSAEDDNVLAVASANSYDETDDETLYTLEFTLPDDIKNGDEFDISLAVDCFANDDEEDVEVTTVNGKIVVVGDKIEETTEITEPTETTTEPKTTKTTENVETTEVTALTESTESTTETTEPTTETDNLTTLTEIYDLKIAEKAADVNGDNTIDSKDAVAVLVDYANSLAGKSTTLENGYGDANADDKVDSKDAVLILQYYAKRLVADE